MIITYLMIIIIKLVKILDLQTMRLELATRIYTATPTSRQVCTI